MARVTEEQSGDKQSSSFLPVLLSTRHSQEECGTGSGRWPVAAFSLIMQQRSFSGSPARLPVAIETMLDFGARPNVTPQTEHLPMSLINEAFARLESGKARYGIVLDAD
jgi:D-arabinose 1-dehydrogenase-like Zn-dependent alcohol dehydrogenase